MQSRSCQSHQEQSNLPQVALLLAVQRAAREAWSDSVGDLCVEYAETPYFNVDFGGLELVIEVLDDKAIIRSLDWSCLLYAESVADAAVSLWPKVVRIARMNGLNTLGAV